MFKNVVRVGVVENCRHSVNNGVGVGKYPVGIQSKRKVSVRRMKMGGKYLTIVILNVERKKKIMKNMQNIITRAYRAYEKKIRRKHADEAKEILSL